MSSTRRPLALAVMSLVTLVWAGNFAAGKIATGRIDPFLIASIRIFLAAAFFTAFLPAAQKRELFKLSLWKACLPLALTGIATNPVSYTHLRAHETPEHLVCRLLLEK